MPDLWTCFEWAVWGIYQYARLIIPVINPDPVDMSPPTVWWVWNSWSDWYQHKDWHNIPDEHWIRRWLWMCIQCIRVSFESGIKNLIDRSRDGIMRLVGYARGGFGTLSDWVDHLHRVTGGFIPGWTSSLANGLDWLRNRLPAPIRDAWQSWDQLFESIRESVRQWVRSTYDWVVTLGRNAWDWAQNQGERVKRWVDSVQSWIDRFRADPYGTITQTLGAAWSWLLGFYRSGRDQVLAWLGPDIGKLLTFGRDCVTFYYNLWARGWSFLGDLIDDAGRVILNKAISEIEKRW